MSFDGVRYGVPWQYSGREVVVRQTDCTIDILFDDHVVIATHQKHYTLRSTCYLEGQYQGIKEVEGHLTPNQRLQSSYPWKSKGDRLKFTISYLEGENEMIELVMTKTNLEKA